MLRIFGWGQVFIFGGQTEDGNLLNDMWQWDLETLQWAQIMYIQTIGGAKYVPCMSIAWKAIKVRAVQCLGSN